MNQTQRGKNDPMVDEAGFGAIPSQASENITQRIAELADWRGPMLAQVRKLIHEAEPNVIEEWKWRGVPVWEFDGIICTGETYKAVVKLTFARGAAIDDPKQLFNSSLEGNVRRAIDLREGDKLDEAAFKKLIKTAVSVNVAARAGKKK
jgi:hypothetical protein